MEPKTFIIKEHAFLNEILEDDEIQRSCVTDSACSPTSATSIHKFGRTKPDSFTCSHGVEKHIEDGDKHESSCLYLDLPNLDYEHNVAHAHVPLQNSSASNPLKMSDDTLLADDQNSEKTHLSDDTSLAENQKSESAYLSDDTSLAENQKSESAYLSDDTSLAENQKSESAYLSDDTSPADDQKSEKAHLSGHLSDDTPQTYDQKIKSAHPFYNTPQTNDQQRKSTHLSDDNPQTNDQKRKSAHLSHNIPQTNDQKRRSAHLSHNTPQTNDQKRKSAHLSDNTPQSNDQKRKSASLSDDQSQTNDQKRKSAQPTHNTPQTNLGRETNPHSPVKDKINNFFDGLPFLKAKVYISSVLYFSCLFFLPFASPFPVNLGKSITCYKGEDVSITMPLDIRDYSVSIAGNVIGACEMFIGDGCYLTNLKYEGTYEFSVQEDILNLTIHKIQCADSNISIRETGKQTVVQSISLNIQGCEPHEKHDRLEKINETVYISSQKTVTCTKGDLLTIPLLLHPNTDYSVSIEGTEIGFCDMSIPKSCYIMPDFIGLYNFMSEGMSWNLTINWVTCNISSVTVKATGNQDIQIIKLNVQECKASYDYDVSENEGKSTAKHGNGVGIGLAILLVIVLIGICGVVWCFSNITIFC